MRALFAVRSASPERNIVVVVPYDRSHILKAFGAEEGEVAPNQNGERSPSEPAKLESDIFEKTFDRIIKVSPPIVSDWRAYLESCLKRAFGDKLGGTETVKIFRLLRLRLQTEKVHPTPRRIIAYVNEIGALWLQWNEIIPVESIALYVIHRREIDRSPEALISPEIIAPRFQRIVGQADWRQQLAALSFNVHPDLADQVLMGQAIGDALTASGAEDLKKLSELPGFLEIFDRELSDGFDEWAGKDALSLSQAASNASELALSEADAGLMWKEFSNQLSTLPDIEYRTADQLPGLFTIVEKQTRQDTFESANLLRTSFERAKDLSDPDLAFQLGGQWTHVIVDICTAIANAHGREEALRFWQSLKVPPNSHFAIGVAASGVIFRDYQFAELHQDVDWEQLGLDLTGYAKSSPGALAFALPQFYQNIKGSAQILMTAVAEELQSSPLDDDRRRNLLDAFIYLRKHNKTMAKEILQPLATDGSLIWHAHASWETDGHASACAIFLACEATGIAGPTRIKVPTTKLADAATAITWFASVFSESPRDEILNELAQLVRSGSDFLEWATFAIGDASPSETFKNVIRKTVANGKFNVSGFLSLSQIYVALRGVLGAEAMPWFLSQLENSAKWVDEKLDLENVVNVPDELILDVAGTDVSSGLRKILTKVDERLASLSEESWNAALVDADSPDLRLLMARQLTGGPKLPVESFMPALAANAVAVLEGKFEPSPSGDRWHTVINSLPSGSHGRVASTVLTSMKSIVVTSAGAEAFVVAYLPIAKRLKLTDDPGVALNQFISFLVTSKIEVVREYLRAKAKDIRACLDAAGDDTKQALQDAMASMALSDDEQGSWETELRKLLKLKKPAPAPDVAVAADGGDA